MENIHGGDIYNNKVNMDFSVNINPFGIPESVKDAMHEAIEQCDRYPDIKSDGLRKAIAGSLSITPENIITGNGASELFMAIVHAIKPKKAIVPEPSFYGYEYALRAVCCQIDYFNTDLETKDSDIDKTTINIDNISGINKMMQDDISMIFLASPNNPTGQITDKATLTAIIEQCKKRNIFVVLDECFIDFCKKPQSLIGLTKQYENLIVVRAFTKIFAIPGVRLGYLVCGNDMLRNKIQRQLPEWNVSVIAQRAGIACLKDTDYVRKTASYVRRQREYLTAGLLQYGFKVYNSDANFILFYSSIPLYELLLKKQILIRDCSNYRGLKKGYYRIAVRTENENNKLLKAIGECIEEYRAFTADGD